MKNNQTYSPLSDLFDIYGHVPISDPDHDSITQNFRALILWIYSREPDAFELAGLGGVPEWVENELKETKNG